MHWRYKIRLVIGIALMAMIGYMYWKLMQPPELTGAPIPQATEQKRQDGVVILDMNAKDTKKP